MSLRVQTLFDDPDNQNVENCQTRLRPYYVVGAIVQLIRAIYSNPDNIPDPLLRQYIWGRDENREDDVNKDKIIKPPTYILIESNKALKQITADTSPAIIVSRGDISPFTEVLGRREQGNHTGADTRVSFFQGTIIVNCVSSQPDEAEMLASMTGSYLEAFGSLIMNTLNLMRFRLTGLGEPKQTKTDPGASWAVPLTFTYGFSTWWAINMEAIPIRDITFDFRLQSL